MRELFLEILSNKHVDDVILSFFSHYDLYLDLLSISGQDFNLFHDKEKQVCQSVTHTAGTNNV